MKIGLVLSGGGIKGAYHLGVLQYLCHENKIEFDTIAGTSIGSIVSVLYELGIEPRLVKDRFKNIKLNSLTVLWNSIGRAGLISSDTMKELILKGVLELEDSDLMKFKDLKKDIYVTATDLMSGKLKVFCKETDPEFSVLHSTLASSSYPMIFSPVEANDTVYTDGGVVNNFPADIIKDKVNYSLGVFLSPLTESSKEELKSSRGVASRVIQLQGANEDLKRLNYCNEIITSRELVDFNAFEHDPEKIEELYEMGYNDAKNNTKLLKILKQLQRYKKMEI
jgi:NTE family protein